MKQKLLITSFKFICQNTNCKSQKKTFITEKLIYNAINVIVMAYSLAKLMRFAN
jgi:hypothetical protein